MLTGPERNYGAAKAELLENIKSGGTIVLNGDDPFCTARLGEERRLDRRPSAHQGARRPGHPDRGVGVSVVELQGNRPPKSYQRRWPLNSLGNMVLGGFTLGILILLSICHC